MKKNITTIDKAEFDKFNSEYIDLRIYEHQKYGQAFCNHYKIVDSELFNAESIKAAEKLIKQKYLVL